MKEATHPTYFPSATVHCAGCDRTYTVGSTKEKLEVELCSNCHPFYTGKQKLVDTAGRVDRYRARAAKAAAKAKQAKATVVPEAKTPTPASTDTPTPAERLVKMKQTLETTEPPKSDSENEQ